MLSCADHARQPGDLVIWKRKFRKKIQINKAKVINFKPWKETSNLEEFQSLCCQMSIHI